MMQHALVAYLINAAWQAPLAALAAAAISHVAGLSPRSRNLVWLAFLIIALVTPALAVDWSPLAKTPAADAQTPSAPLQAPDEPSAASAAPPPALPLPALGPTSDPGGAGPLRLLRLNLDARSNLAIRLAFAAAMAFALARLALAGAAARRLVRRSRPLVLPAPLSGAMDAFARRQGCIAPAVRCSDSVASPVVVGALKPMILVPERFAALAIDDQRAALLHEMAHVARRDYAVNLACEAASLPLSWHPAIHAIKAGARRTREMACDAMASSAMASEEAYARCLLSLARTLGAPRPGDPAAAMVGLFGRSDLEERLMHLLAPKTVEDRGLRAARLSAAAALAALAVAPAVLLHVTPALASAQPPSAPVPARPPAAAHPATLTSSIDPAQASAQAISDAAPRTAHVRAHQRHHPASPAQIVATLPPLPPVRPLPAIPPIPHLAAVSTLKPILGVLIDADGETVMAEGDKARRMADEGRRRWEAEVHKAMDRAAEAQKVVRSADFQRRLSELIARQTQLTTVERERLQQQLEAAQAAMNDARVKEAIAQAQVRVASAAMRQSQIEADRIRQEIERAMREAEKARARSDDDGRTDL